MNDPAVTDPCPYHYPVGLVMPDVLIMVTGHRPPRLGGYRVPNPTERWVRASLRTLLQGFQRRLGQVSALSGMALGADQLYAEVALDLGVPLYAAVPFEGQESQWPQPAQGHYRALLERCVGVVVVCGPGYAPWKMHRRNEYMVARASHAIAVWDGSQGGTGHTVGAIRREGVPAVRVDPRERVVGAL